MFLRWIQKRFSRYLDEWTNNEQVKRRRKRRSGRRIRLEAFTVAASSATVGTYSLSYFFIYFFFLSFLITAINTSIVLGYCLDCHSSIEWMCTLSSASFFEPKTATSKIICKKINEPAMWSIISLKFSATTYYYFSFYQRFFVCCFLIGPPTMDCFLNEKIKNGFLFQYLWKQKITLSWKFAISIKVNSCNSVNDDNELRVV